MAKAPKADEPTLQELVAQEEADAAVAAASKADETAESTEESGTEDTETQAGGGEPSETKTSDPDYLKWLEEKTGYRFSDRYKTGEEAAQGIRNALQLVGQRNEDAALAKALRQKLSEEQITKLLEGTPDTASKKQDDGIVPQTFREYELLLEKANKAGDPNDPDYRRAVAASRAISEAQFTTARLVPELQRKIETLEKSLTEREAEWRANSQDYAVRNWLSEHATEFVQKDNPQQRTAFGDAVLRAYSETHDHSLVASEPENSLNRWEFAYMAAKASMPTPKPTQTPTKQTMRQAGSTVKTTKQSDAAALFKQFEGQADQGAKVLEMLVSQYAEAED